VGQGESVTIPLRLGIGGALFGFTENDFNLAVRVPFEVALKFRRSPLELYGEIALKLTFVREDGGDPDLDADGGIGLRFYF
jgi:hypothetical protein